MSATSTSAPAPSRHIFLHELPTQEEGSKVRFLCFVREYSTRTGYLLVEHAYPEDSVHSPRAYIDVSLVLESAKSELKHDGMWLNVLGYVRRNASTGPHRGSSEPLLPLVQALLIWDAGALDVKSYERVLQQQMDVRVHSRGILQKAHKALDRKA